MDIRLWLGGELLSVSWWCNVSLKSHAKSQGKMCEEAKEVRSSQNYKYTLFYNKIIVNFNVFCEGLD